MDDNIFYETSSSSSSENTVMGSFPAGGILFFIVSLSFLCILTWQSVVKFIQKTCAGSNGSRGCGCFCRRNDRDEDDDDSHGSQEPFEEDGDRILAMELQRQLNEEASESNRMAKRKERRMWYEYYLKPWTMVRSKTLDGIDCCLLGSYEDEIRACCVSRVLGFFSFSEPQLISIRFFFSRTIDRKTIRFDPRTRPRC